MTRNTRQLELLIAQSERTKRRMIFWIMVSSIGAFASIIVWLNDTTNALLFGMTTAALVGGFFIAAIEAFSYAKYNGILWEYFEDDQPPPPPDLGRPTFESETRPPPMMVQTDNNTLSLLPFGFDENQWHILVRRLVANSTGGTWKWNKKILHSTGLFTEETTPGYSITRGNDYGRICREFERLRLIEGGMSNWTVTGEGKRLMSLEGARLPVIPGRG